MNRENTALALGVVLVGAAMLSRKASATVADDSLLEEINVTARRLAETPLFSELFGADLPLGLRNNNPMNVRETSITWQGELPHDGDGYEDFAEPGDGIRAGARVLLNYQRKHELMTIRGMITRYAPHADNNPTESYVNFVSRALNVPADARFSVEDIENLTLLAEAIIQFENGQQPFTRAFIRDNVRRAF